MSVPKYLGPPFYFCTNLNPSYTVKQCDGQTVLVPPKKAIVYNKPQHNLTKSEYLAWLSRNKYR
jgi:hypothetical protein